MDGRKSKVCPQKQPFLRMKGRKSMVCPQKQPFLRMDGRKSMVCPQKQAFLRMDCSFLILVDYLDVLSLRRVDSVYKL